MGILLNAEVVSRHISTSEKNVIFFKFVRKKAVQTIPKDRRILAE